MQNLIKAIAVTLFLLVSPGALAIVAVDDYYITAQDQTTFMNVFSNDDIDNFGALDPIADEDAQVISGDVDTVFFSNDGLEIIPASGYVGIIELEYTISDPSGSSQARVILDVQADPAAHQALDDIFYTDEAVSADLRLIANDNFNRDNGYPSVIVSSTTTEQGGTLFDLNGDGGDFRYTPPAGFTGIDTFTYDLQDPVTEETSTGAQVTIYVGVDPDLASEPLGPVAGLSQEEQQIYGVITDICESEASGDIPCEDIGQLNDSEVKDLMQQISGRHAKLQGRTMRQSRGEQSDNVRSRLKEIRGGLNRVSVNNLNASIFGKSVPVASLLQGKLNSELQGGSAGDGDITTPWGFFVNGNLSLGEATSRNDRPDYEQDGYNLTMGLDYRISDKLVAGLAAGYSKSDMNFSRDFGSQESDSYSLSLFGNYYPRDNIYIDGLLMLVNGGMDVERRISVGPISQHLSSDTDNQQIVLSTSAGYEFSVQRLQGSVYGRLEYSDMTIDGYRESGDSFALAIAEQNTSSFDGAIGTRLGYVFNLSRGVVVPSIELEYVKRQEDDYTIEGRFLSAPLSPSFVLNAEEEDTQHLNLSTSVSAVFSGGRSGFFRYEKMLMQDNYDMSSYSLGFRMEF